MKVTYSSEAILLQLNAGNSYLKFMSELTKKSEARKCVSNNPKYFIQTWLPQRLVSFSSSENMPRLFCQSYKIIASK